MRYAWGRREQGGSRRRTARKELHYGITPMGVIVSHLATVLLSHTCDFPAVLGEEQRERGASSRLAR